MSIRTRIQAIHKLTVSNLLIWICIGDFVGVSDFAIYCRSVFTLSISTALTLAQRAKCHCIRSLRSATHPDIAIISKPYTNTDRQRDRQIQAYADRIKTIMLYRCQTVSAVHCCKPRNQYLKANQFSVRTVDFMFLFLYEHFKRSFARSLACSIVHSFVWLLLIFSFTIFIFYSFFRLFSCRPSLLLYLSFHYIHSILTHTLFHYVAIKYLVLRLFVFVVLPTKPVFVSRCGRCDSTVRYATSCVFS